MGYFPEDHEVVDRLQRETGRINDEKGFRDDWELANWLDQFGEFHEGVPPETRDKLFEAAKAVRRNVIGMKLTLVHSEVTEMLEVLRDMSADLDERTAADHFAEEGADVVIRILDLLDMLKLPVGQVLIDKIKANKDRPHKHGREC